MLPGLNGQARKLSARLRVSTGLTFGTRLSGKLEPGRASRKRRH